GTTGSWGLSPVSRSRTRAGRAATSGDPFHERPAVAPCGVLGEARRRARKGLEAEALARVGGPAPLVVVGLAEELVGGEPQLESPLEAVAGEQRAGREPPLLGFEAALQH